MFEFICDDNGERIHPSAVKWNLRYSLKGKVLKGVAGPKIEELPAS